MPFFINLILQRPDTPLFETVYTLWVQEIEVAGSWSENGSGPITIHPATPAVPALTEPVPAVDKITICIKTSDPDHKSTVISWSPGKSGKLLVIGNDVLYYALDIDYSNRGLVTEEGKL
ncbi:MAG: hypothetical protein JEY99_10190 [Spirochaetales bacterium]|nr:hypothetical protein [Spirochaetales bacterium]